MKKILSLIISASIFCMMANFTETVTTDIEAYDTGAVVLDESSGYTDMMNYTMPKFGEEIVEMVIKDKGTIRIKLFPELLPKACENFTSLVSQGYYNGLTFHRVISDFMIQGGDPNGTGTGGESVWGGKFDGGYSKYLYHVKGALAYANSELRTSNDGSQFYIVVGEQYNIEDFMESSPYNNKINYTDNACKAYEENGGTPWLDGYYTVFGQVFEGLDIVTDICNNTATDPKNDKPLDPVIIEKASVVKYGVPTGSSDVPAVTTVTTNKVPVNTYVTTVKLHPMSTYATTVKLPVVTTSPGTATSNAVTTYPTTVKPVVTTSPATTTSNAVTTYPTTVKPAVTTSPGTATSNAVTTYPTTVKPAVTTSPAATTKSSATTVTTAKAPAVTTVTTAKAPVVTTVTTAKAPAVTTTSSSTESTVKTTSSAKLGDLNGDSELTTSDVRIILQGIIGSVKLTDEQVKNADIDGDGVLKTIDAIRLLNYIVGNTDSL